MDILTLEGKNTKKRAHYIPFLAQVKKEGIDFEA